MNRKAIGKTFSKATALGFLLFSVVFSIPILFFIFNLPPLHEKETWKAIGGFLILSAFIVYCAYTGWIEFFPQHKIKLKERKEGIWGLLLLPPIGLAILAYQSATTIYEIYSSGALSTLYGTYETLLSVLVGLLAIFLLIPFFRKDKRIPLMMIGFYMFLIFTTVISILMVLLTQQITGDQGLALFFTFLKQSAVSAVWIIYFMSSERVKHTFTEKKVDQDGVINSESLRSST
jgi:drug/metabolite transporter (DMT)-like permease